MPLGSRVPNPFRNGDDKKVEFKPNFYPTFFKLKKPYSIEKPREVEVEKFVFLSKLTLQMIIFTRVADPGEFSLFFEGEEITNADGMKLSGYQGNWTLTLPSRNEFLQQYEIVVKDINRATPFKEKFLIKLIEARENDKVPPKPRPPKPSGFNDLPKIIEIINLNLKNIKLMKGICFLF